MKFLVALLPAVLSGATTTILGLGAFNDPGVTVERYEGQTILAGVAMDVPMREVKEITFQFAWADEFLAWQTFETPEGVSVKADVRTDGPVDRATITATPADGYAEPFLGWARFRCGRSTYTPGDGDVKKPGPVALTARNVVVVYDDGSAETLGADAIYNPDRLWTKRRPAKAAVRLAPGE